jgi:hypothetical protein
VAAIDGGAIEAAHLLRGDEPHDRSVIIAAARGCVPRR